MLYKGANMTNSVSSNRPEKYNTTTQFIYIIGIEFIWIDTENPPSDTIGWVAKK